jgi:expansin (peptidoglycan-binding protein)
VTAPRTFSPRLLAAGGAVALAVIAGVALLLHQTTAAGCAAPPTGNSARSGKATFYTMGGGTGNCSFASLPSNDLYVALGNSQYSSAGACGGYLDVTGPKGKVRVKVVDRCPECAVGHLDLSRTAFKKIADEVQGLVSVRYRAVVNAPTPGPLSVRFKDGTSRYWFAVLIDNHANPLRSVQAKGPGAGYRSAKRADYNYWIIDGGAGAGPFAIKITDLYGHSATATGIRIQPGKTQTTSVRLTGSGGSVAAPATPAKKPSRSASAKPSPTPSATVATPATPLVESTVAPTGPAAALAAADDDACD